jgi:hypothetical protein
MMVTLASLLRNGKGLGPTGAVMDFESDSKRPKY